MDPLNVPALERKSFELRRLKFAPAASKLTDDPPGRETFTPSYQQFDQVVNIPDVGNVMNCDLFISQQDGADHLEGFVFGALWEYFPPEFPAPGDLKRAHSWGRFLFR